MNILEEYQKVLTHIDKECNDVTSKFDFIPCKKRCADCCKQFFSISFIEAYNLSREFHKLPEKKQEELRVIAKNYRQRIKFPFEKYYKGDRELIYDKYHDFVAFTKSQKVICPYLNDDLMCDVYSARPHDCRVHGVSFDKEQKEVLGCFRHKEIEEFDKVDVRQNLVDFYFKYTEVRVLDSALIRSFSGHPQGVKVWYFTDLLEPILKDYEKEDWASYFKQDWESVEQGKYLLFLDI